MISLNLDNKKVLIISTLFLLLVSSGLVLYYNDKLNKQNIEFNEKLSKLNSILIANIESLKGDIISLQNNLTFEMEAIDTSLNSFRNKNEKDINALNDLIDEIEKQSELKLGELKDELKSIRVKSNDFTAIIDDVLQSVVSIGTNKAQGSGVIVGDAGFIVTNYHVVDDANIIRILTYEGDVYDATLIGFNDIVDIAVLKVDASLKELRFGDSDDVDIGSRVIALGNPAGLSFTVTEGIISAVGRKGPNNLNIYLQTDVPINPGNSGGPLVDINSRIIGINNFKIGGFEGLGFAIESNSVEQVVDDIIDKYLQSIQE